jgi:hypothetical protein
MRVACFLENPAWAAALLKTLGWHAYATDSQGARVPPPTYDQEAPELPFASFLDGIVYQLEPWEQAPRERLASYARECDDLAGIVVYDGECDDTSGSPPPNATIPAAPPLRMRRYQRLPPSESDARRQDLDESLETVFQYDLDQRPRPQ